MSIFGLISIFPQAKAQTGGTVLDFFITAQPIFDGLSYNVFSPQSLVVQQGDQVNLTVRNVGEQGFHLQIEGQPVVDVQAGTQNGSSVTPVDTTIPLFTASAAGIFGFYAVEFPQMIGQIVVLPSDWVRYNPAVQTRNFMQIIVPDFAGDGYDKYVPGVMVVNQGDKVNLTIRNMDDMAHGFALAAFGLDVAINSGQVQADGSISPVDTNLPFTASTAGVFRFLCTVPCGPGHFEMVGSLMVLPTGNRGYNPEPTTEYGYLTIKPDVADEGYDKYVPETVLANQNDLVYIKIRNTDTAMHGFSLPNYNINNIDIAPATENATIGLVPTDTYISEFYATQSGVFEFFCSNNCGAGHDQMIGYLVVLPMINGSSSTYSPSPIPVQPMSTVIFGGLSIALLVVGILIGIIVVKRFGNEDEAAKR